MRSSRDSFLTYLAVNLPSFTIKNIRVDPQFPELSRVTTGAINIQFLADNPQVAIGVMTVSIDCVAEKELDVVAMEEAVFKLLSCNSMCPQFDYTNPTAPTSLGTNLFWDPDSINFRPVMDKLYCRHSGLLYLSYHLY